MMINEKILKKLLRAPIFSSADISVLKQVLCEDGVEIAEYKKGDVIYGITSFRFAVGFILKGEAKVVKGESAAVISVLSEGDIFGCASLFGERDYYVNDIVALCDCRVLFIGKEAVEKLMLRDSNFSLAFIRYLSDRLYYLNMRIGTFTAGTAESKIASYLLSRFKIHGSDEITLSMSHMALECDIGRATAYRGLEKLCLSGAVEKLGKTIKLVNGEELKRFLPD